MLRFKKEEAEVTLSQQNIEYAYTGSWQEAYRVCNGPRGCSHPLRGMGGSRTSPAPRPCPTAPGCRRGGMGQLAAERTASAGGASGAARTALGSRWAGITERTAGVRRAGRRPAIPMWGRARRRPQVKGPLQRRGRTYRMKVVLPVLYCPTSSTIGLFSKSASSRAGEWKSWKR